MVGSAADREVFREAGYQAEGRQRAVAEGGQSPRQPWAGALLPIFIPPAVFDEMLSILNPPMTTNGVHQVLRARLLDFEAGDEMAGF